MQIHIGGDVSKGYADFCITDNGGRVLQEVTLDDTAKGHQRMRQLITELADRDDEVAFRVGMEATGGMELNWLHLFKQLEREVELTSYQVNPYVLKRFIEQQLHANKTDPLSARALADYLRRGVRPQTAPFSAQKTLMGLRTLERTTQKTIRRASQLKTELQALLQRAHPELIQYCRSELPKWLLALIQRFPTPERLAAASVEEISEIPYVTAERAAALRAAAEQSVACQQDEDTGLTLELMAEDVLHLQERIKALKERLWRRLSVLEEPQILRSIDGIGAWAATVLYCEIGEISRFPSSEQLIAFAGLDSQRDYSGDQRIDRSISKRGNRRIRSMLYNCVRVTLRDGSNPPLRDLYDRLRGRGKPHMVAMVACMRKLLAIVYGCWSKGERFDPEYEQRLKARKERRPQGASQRKRKTNLDLQAPISRREAQRRREVAQPQESKGSRMRGQSASPPRIIPHEKDSFNP